MARSLKICFAASEVSPFAKTGGLADVASALPRELHNRRHDVRLFVPLYSQIDRSAYELRPVEEVTAVPVLLGWKTYTFSLLAARLPDSALEVFLVDCPELFHREALYTGERDDAIRFALLSRAVIESCQRLQWAPDVFHCNDWHTALIPFLLRTVYDWDAMFKSSRTLLTIHNLGYQGSFPRELVEELGLGEWSHLLDQDELGAGRFGFLRTGLIYADVVSTVSPTYAREIQTPDYGMGLDGLLRARTSTLVGILNGVDYAEWSPESDAWIPHRYSASDPSGKLKNKRYLLGQLGLDADTDAPLLGVVSRLVHHKGFDLCFTVLPELLARTDLRMVVVGTGEKRYEEFFEHLQQSFGGRVCYHRGYNDELAHMIEAASDLLLMPSRYEPCGLNQLFSLRYGTLPVVRRTGGLADSVQPIAGNNGGGTGFVFDEFSPGALRGALEHALGLYRDRKAWEAVRKNAMTQDFSWQRQADRYVDLYRWLAPA